MVLPAWDRCIDSATVTPAELLVDAFTRIRNVVHSAVTDLSPEQLAYKPDATANSIAWLVWHLTRIQDDHIADVADVEQVWTSQGWHERFGKPFEPSATGYGQRTSDVDALGGQSTQLLIGYYDAVHEQTIRYVAALDGSDLDRIVDEGWDPPVSLATRLVSVISDDLQHAGQAGYLHGIVARR
jgi:uncharacterized damage-inducible protein DinB